MFILRIMGRSKRNKWVSLTLLLPSIISCSSIVADFGYNTLSLRDVATSKGTKAVDVSPVEIMGNGYHLGMLLETGYWKQHSVGIYLITLEISDTTAEYTRLVNLRTNDGILL